MEQVGVRSNHTSGSLFICGVPDIKKEIEQYLF